MIIKDYYRILNIGVNASNDEIKRAYRKLSKQWHPDINKSSNAHEYFININEAYNILIKPETRRLYDMYYYVQYPTIHFNDSDIETNATLGRVQGETFVQMEYEEFLIALMNFTKTTGSVIGCAILMYIGLFICIGGIGITLKGYSWMEYNEILTGIILSCIGFTTYMIGRNIKI